MQNLERLDKLIQALLRTDSGEVANRETVVAAQYGLTVMAFQVNSQRKQMKLVFGQAQVPRHEVPIVSAVDEEPVKGCRLLLNQLDGTALVGFDQGFQKHVVPLQDAIDLSAKRSLQVLQSADQQ